MANSISSSSSFPHIHLVPKQETNVLEFLSKYPQYNGKDVIIGILDTGVDPAAHGLQECGAADDLFDYDTTSTGTTLAPRVKLLDIVDCTGAGDVQLYDATAEYDKDTECYTVKGLSGRTLTIPKDWKMESFPTSDTASIQEGETVSIDNSKPVRLGIKAAFELFSPRLTPRIKQARKQQLQRHQNRYTAETQAKLVDIHAKLATDKSNASLIKAKQNIQALLDVIMDSCWEKPDEDPGPVYDCLVFYDGDNYRAVVDVNEHGNLADYQPMTDFDKFYEYASFGTLAQLNFGVHFYEDGKILSIVTDCSPHGTHVASIAAGNDGERSGVAPGAQVVSFVFGDLRLGTTETGTAFARCMMEAVRHKCDVINMSFGDYVSISNVGRLKELADELVWKHNVVFVSSAGNEGPALSTVGAPGGAYSSIIGVGAYVSSNMKDAMHSLMSDISNEEEATDHDNNAESEGVSGTNYTWSSRGPTFDGDWGVDITAPGGAITSVSNWTLQKSQLMCGTSMSSPHATGCVALLISACKAEGIPITPARIRKALLNTADFRLNMTAPDQGQGLLQVDKAFAYLQQTKDVAAEDIFFQATVQNRTGNTRGIYLRQSHETGVKQMCEIFINPQFRLEDVPSEATQRQKIDFEMSIRLVTDKGWVKVPSNMFLMNNGRSFTVDVDPTELSPGLHTAKIWGYDTSSPSSHAIFSLPVTITKPLPQQRTLSFSKLELQSAEIKRFFVTPPFGSTWMDISIHDSRSPTDESSGVAVHLHTVQVIRHASHRDYSKHRRLSMRPGQTIVTSIAVEENVTAEIVLASGWSNATAHWLDASVEFRGVRPTPRSVHMTADSGGALVRITSDLKDESVNPEAKLTHWLTPLRPSADIVLRPLGLRDTFHDLDTKIFELILTYEFEQETKGPVTPRAGLLQDFLYDSAFESQLMLFFDKDKKLVGSSDAYPRSVTLPKGDITLRLQIRHNDPKVLENLKTMCLSMERKLEKPVAVSAYSSKTAFSSGESALKLSTLKQGNTAPVYFANPTTIPSTCKLGDVLRGTVTYASGDKSLSGEGKRPGGFPISFVVGPKEAKAASDTETPEPKDERSAQEKLADDIRKVKISCLEKMPELDDFTELFQQLETDYPRHIPLLVARLKFLDAHKSRGDLLETIVDAAESVIALISEIELAQHFGRAIDKEDHETVKLNKDLAEKKDFLVDALARQALAYADMTAPDAAEKFQEALRHLKSWIDIESSEKYAALYMEQESRAGRHGNVLKTLGKLLEKDVKDTLRPMNRLELLEKRVALLEQVGFDALAEYDKRSQMLAAPKSYCLF